MNTSKSRLRALLATTSVTALMAVGSGPLHAQCVHITGPSAGHTNSVAGMIDCINVNNAALTGDVVNHGAITPGSPDGIIIQNSAAIVGSIINTGTISAIDGAITVRTVATFTGGISNSGTLSGGAGIFVGSTSTFTGGITNSGALSGTFSGMNVQTVSSFSGGMTNSGSITAAGTTGALYAFGVAAFTGGIVNSGTISSGGVGIQETMGGLFSGGITNAGGITAVGDAIQVSTTSNFSGGIANTGQIQATAAIGIDVNNVALFAGGISNSGTITSGDAAISVDTVANFSGGINNSGTLAVTSQGSGIVVNLVSAFSGGIQNSGTIIGFTEAAIRIATVSTFLGGIVNSGSLSSTYTVINILSSPTFAGGITNSGTINGTKGIQVSAGNTFSGAIVNSGMINATNEAIDVSDAPNAMTINQTAGTINGDILLSPFGDVVTVSGGAINGNIVGLGPAIVNFALGSGSFTHDSAYTIVGVDQLNFNSGLVTLNGTAIATNVAVNSGFVTLNGTAIAANVAINGGTLEVGDATHPGATLLAANGITVATGGTLAGHGSVVADLAVPTGATLSPGGSIGTLNVTGNLSLAAGSFYHVEVNPAGASSKTVATGTATIAGGTVQVTEQPGVYSPTIIYTILTANLGVTGTFDAATSDMLFLIPELAYDANNVFLTLTRNATFFADAAQTSNQTGVGEALDASALDSALLQPILTQTAAGARAAFDALSGEVHATLQGVLIDNARYMRQAMLGRLRQGAYADAADNGLAPLGFAGPVASIPGGTTLSASIGDLTTGAIPDEASVFPSKLTFWSQAVGAWGTIDGDGNAAETHRDFGGLFTGVDARFGEAGRIGIAGGYTQSSASVDERLSSADVDSGQVGVYAATRLDAFNLRAGAAYAFHDIETSRTIAFPGFLDTASADYDGDTGQIFGEVGYGIRLGQMAAEPFAGLAWVHVGTDGFAETGGVAALDGADSDNGVGYSTLGIRLATRIMLDDGTTLVPRASAAWQHVFGDVAPTAALAFQNTGTDFGVTGVPIARNAALVEAGVDVLISPEAKLGISYSGELAEDQQDHAVKGNLSWRF